MKKSLIFCLLLYNCLPLFSQSYSLLPSKNTFNHILDSVNKNVDDILSRYRTSDASIKDGKKLMKQEYFNRFFSKYLSYVNFSKDGYPDGNSVLLEPTSNSTRLRTTLAYKGNYIVYNMGAEVNAYNNIGAIVSNKSIAGNTTFFTSFSIISKKSRGVKYSANQSIENYHDKLYLIEKFKSDLNKKYLYDYACDSMTYYKLVDSLDRNKSNPSFLANYYNALQKLYSYGFNLDQNFFEEQQPNKIGKINDSLKNIIDSVELNNSAWAFFHFSWFSGSASYTKDDYTTYNAAAAFSKRISDVNFDSLAFNIGFNHLFERSQPFEKFQGISCLDKKWLRSFFYTFNYSLSRDINYAHLKQVSLLTNQTATGTAGSADSAYVLQSQTKGINITNIPKITGLLHTFSIQGTLILSQSAIMGFNLALNASFGKLTIPVYSGRFGLLFRFKDSQTAKSKVNFELFLKLADWVDSQYSGLSTWQRKTIGISASLPFNKLFF